MWSHHLSRKAQRAEIHPSSSTLSPTGVTGSRSRTMQRWSVIASQRWTTGKGSSSAAWQVILRLPFQPGDLLGCVAGVWRAYKLAVWPGLVSAVHSSVAGRWGDVWLVAADLYTSSGSQRRRPNPLGLLYTTAARWLRNVGSFTCFIPLFIKVVAFTDKLSR